MSRSRDERPARTGWPWTLTNDEFRTLTQRHLDEPTADLRGGMCAVYTIALDETLKTSPIRGKSLHAEQVATLEKDAADAR